MVFGPTGRFAYGVNQGRLSHPAPSLNVYDASSHATDPPLRLIATLPTLPVRTHFAVSSADPAAKLITSLPLGSVPNFGRGLQLEASPVCL